MQEFFDDLQQNPLLLGLFAVIFIIAVILLHKKASTTMQVNAIPTNDSTNPGTPIIYENVYEQYPTSPNPVPAPNPVPTPNPVPLPIPVIPPIIPVPAPNPKPITGPLPPVPNPGTPNPPIPPKPVVPPVSHEQYVTVLPWGSGAWQSTMYSIAQHYGISLSHLEALNPTIHNVNLIYPGQRIRVA